MLNALLRILALTCKELLAVFKDPRSRNSVIVPPILQCLIFGYVATYDLTDVPYALVDRDRGLAARDFVARLDGSQIFHKVASFERAVDATRLLNDKEVLLVLQIDADFERKLRRGGPAEVQVIADGRNSNTAGIAIGYLSGIIDSFNQNWRRDHGQKGMPIRLITRAWYNPNLETRWHMVPALIGTLTFIQCLMLSGLSVAREREQGTFDQLLVTPFGPVEIMIGKAVPAVLVGIMQATLILLVAQLWFRIPFAGAFITLYAGLGVFLLAAVGMGLLLSAVALTMQQAMLFAFLIIMPFSLLSGLTTPISGMPTSLQYFTMLNPLRYAIEIAHRVYLEGASLSHLVPQLWPLALIALITLTASTWMFRHRLA